MALDLRNMDCMKLMREFPDKHFDLAIVDPPIGIDMQYFNELFRVSKNQIILGGKSRFFRDKEVPDVDFADGELMDNGGKIHANFS